MGNLCSSGARPTASEQPTYHTLKAMPGQRAGKMLQASSSFNSLQSMADSVSSMGASIRGGKQAGKQGQPAGGERTKRNSLLSDLHSASAAELELHDALAAAHVELRRGRARSLKDFYELGPVLGTGKYSRVHAAVRTADGTQVAVKVLLKKEGGKEVLTHQKKKVANEVAVMRLLGDHPNAVQLLEVFQDDEAFYLVMEHCSGGELFDHVYKEGPLSEADAASITRQLASLLAHAHSKHIMHRDIKPENMLLAKPLDASKGPDKWMLKVADYGGAVFCPPSASLHHQFGTVYYVAPEVLLQRYDVRADLWSVGVVLHLLLLDYLPFEGPDHVATLMLVMAGEPDTPAQDWAKMSTPARKLVKALLHMNPGDRPTAAALLKHPWVQQAPAGN